MNSGWLSSPAVLISLFTTMCAGLYAYLYLPVQMRRAYRQSLLILARAVETKDLRAAGRGERVAYYVMETARRMRVPAAQIQRIEYAAFLQDVGNVRVPHAVLNKTGRLSTKEFEILKAHATIGAEMVEQVKFLKDISPMIRHHHEHWDGSGYPDALKGEDIPLGARILLVAMSFDAMTHEKVYRRKLSEEEAIQSIRAGAGTKYDPAVVEAFLKALHKQHRNERFPS